MHNYLVEHNVQYTSLDSVRIGITDESAAPSLSSEVAVGLRAFLLEDVHVELIRESVVTTFASL
jgi:hypothetical protein